MHPLDTARALNDAAGGTSWEQDVAAHLLHGGHFYADGESVLLWRPVSRHWTSEALLNPWQSDPEGDAWYIWMGVGNLRPFLAMATSGGWPAKSFIAFHRKGIPRWHRLATLVSRLDEKLKQQRSAQGEQKGQRPVSEELRGADEDDAEADEDGGAGHSDADLQAAVSRPDDGKR